MINVIFTVYFFQNSKEALYGGGASIPTGPQNRESTCFHVAMAAPLMKWTSPRIGLLILIIWYCYVSIECTLCTLLYYISNKCGLITSYVTNLSNCKQSDTRSWQHVVVACAIYTVYVGLVLTTDSVYKPTLTQTVVSRSLKRNLSICRLPLFPTPHDLIIVGLLQGFEGTAVGASPICYNCLQRMHHNDRVRG